MLSDAPGFFQGFLRLTSKGDLCWVPAVPWADHAGELGEARVWAEATCSRNAYALPFLWGFGARLCKDSV